MSDPFKQRQEEKKRKAEQERKKQDAHKKQQEKVQVEQKDEEEDYLDPAEGAGKMEAGKFKARDKKLAQKPKEGGSMFGAEGDQADWGALAPQKKGA